jgi:hypothetical protein
VGVEEEVMEGVVVMVVRWFGRWKDTEEGEEVTTVMVGGRRMHALARAWGACTETGVAAVGAWCSRRGNVVVEEWR